MDNDRSLRRAFFILRRVLLEQLNLDYRALSDGARLSQDIRLIEGDVILVPERRLFE